MKKFIIAISALLLLSFPMMGTADAAKKEKKEKQAGITVPNSVLTITKENTYPNPTEDMPKLEPSELTKELLQSSNVKIENPELIRMLNETTINSTPFAVGYRAIVFLGQWPLYYESEETAPNWEYQKINTNYIDNRGGQAPYTIHYVQETQKIVKGGLNVKVENPEEVKKMMLLKAMDKSKLPLAFETVIGGGTKKDHKYNVPAKRLGYLYGYAPAVNEKGKVTYGEVYVMLKGNKKSIVVKNITSQGVGAWIPIQDHVAFGFYASETPR